MTICDNANVTIFVDKLFGYFYWPSVRPFRHSQLLAKGKVLDSEIRSDFELRPHEQNKISKHFHHDYNLADACKFVYDFQKYEYLRRITQSMFERREAF